MDKSTQEYVKKLVKARLHAMPPTVSFSIGGYGDFTPEQLIAEIDDDSEIGREAIDMQLDFIRKTPTLLSSQII